MLVSGLTPFQFAVARLSDKGVRLTWHGGDYIINYLKPLAAAEYRCSELDEALAHGLAMPPRPAVEPPLGPMGKPGGSKRGKMYRQNKKIAYKRARAAAKEKP